LKTKYMRHVFVAGVLLLLLLSLLLIPVFAAKTVTPIANCVTVTDSNNTGQLSGDVVTVTASGFWSSKTNTVTITNIGSSKAVITFDYAATGQVSSFSETDYVGSKEITLEGGETYQMTISNPKQSMATTTATLSLSKFTYKPIIEGSVTITHNAYGTVKVDGSTIASGGTTGTITSEGAQFVATSISGASFVAWVNKDTNQILSQTATYDFKPSAASMNIEAVFAPTSGEPCFKISDTLYTSLAKALEAVASSSDKKIVQISSGTLTNSMYTIPNGVSLVVPYLATDTTIQTKTEIVEGPANSTYENANMKLYSGLYGNGPTANVLLPDKEVTYTLTIPKETTVTVASGGKFVIGGTIVAGNVSNTGISGGTAGPHSNVQLEGTLNVNGILSSCGYILGGGTVNVNSGGTLYQPFIFMDYINGQYVVASNDDKTFPFNRYAMINVQSDLHVVAGGVIKGYVDLYTSTVSVSFITVIERHNVACIPVIAQKEGLIRLTSGTLDISYDSTRYAKDDAHNAQGLYDRVGTTTMDFRGEASFNSFSLTINVAASDYVLDSSKDAFAIPYNYIINLSNPENGNGTYTIVSKVRLMPGATMTVEEGATLNVNDNGVLVIMDGFRDHSAVATTVDPANWNNFHYPSATVLENSPGINTGVANLIVNGTLNVASTGTFGGLVQTNGSGKILMNGKAGVEGFKVGSPNYEKLLGLMDNPVTGRTLYNVAARVRNCRGDVIKMEQGKVYYGYSGTAHEAGDCSYRVYLQNNSDTTTSLSIDINSTVVGTWCVETLIGATEPTCTATGLTEGTHCPDCKKTFVEQIVVDALGHNEVTDAAKAPTCTETGLTEGCHCSRCNEVFTAQEVIQALGHEWSAWSIDNATHTCTSACGNDSGHKISVLLEYRLNDYIWLNATVSSTAGNPVCSDASIAYEQYLIKKVLSNHITDSVKVSFTLNGTTPDLEIGFPAYAALLKSYIPEVEEERTDAQKKLYNLLTAMEKYGTAADVYFDPDADTTTGIDFDDLTCPNKDGEIVRPGTHPMGLQHGALNSYTYGEQTYQLKSLGASFFFDECITLRMNYAMQGFDTSKLNTGDTIVQIGVLVGNSGEYLVLSDPENGTVPEELRADDGKYDLAYILYGAGSSGQDENYPNLPGYSGTEKDNPVTSLDSVDFDAMYVNFDLKAKEYTQQFALRPFVVIQHSDTTCTVLYGEQYLYGLENYVYNICTNKKYDSQAKILAFRNFLVRTWDYALAADAKYK